MRAETDVLKQMSNKLRLKQENAVGECINNTT